MSKHLDALEKLFDSVEEEIGCTAGPKTCEALGEARQLINDDRAARNKEPKR